MSIQDLMDEIRALPREERARLVEWISTTLVEEYQHRDEKTHNVLEFYGAGAGSWTGMDVNEYLSRLRDEWDKPR